MKNQKNSDFFSKKRIAGVIGLFSAISFPVSGLNLSFNKDNSALASMEQVSTGSPLDGYLESAQLRGEKESEQSVLIVRDNALLAYAVAEQSKQGEQESKKLSMASVVKKSFGRVEMTAYSSTPDQTDSSPFITANGTHVHEGTLACNFLPFGTKVKIPEYFGDRIFIVEDRMAKRFSNRMDVWFPSRSAAMQFGKRYLEYVVVE